MSGNGSSANEPVLASGEEEVPSVRPTTQTPSGSARRNLQFEDDDGYLLTPPKKRKTSQQKVDRYVLSSMNDEDIRNILDQLLSSDEDGTDEGSEPEETADISATEGAVIVSPPFTIPIIDISAFPIPPESTSTSLTSSTSPTYTVLTPATVTPVTLPASPIYFSSQSEESSFPSLSPSTADLPYGMSLTPSSPTSTAQIHVPPPRHSPDTPIQSHVLTPSPIPPAPVRPHVSPPPIPPAAVQSHVSPPPIPPAPVQPDVSPRPPPPTHASTARQYTWSPTPPLYRPDFDFTADASLKIVPNGNDPEDYFNLMFSEEFFQLVVQETNSFSEELFLRQGDLSRARITDWKDTSVIEVRKFLGLHFHMGMIQLHRQKDYWSTHELFSLPFFRKHMPRDRWMALQQAFHLAPNPNDNEPQPTDPLFKLRPMVVYFHEQMKRLINPGKNVCGDESMAPWRGRISFRQYLPLKSHKYGIKLYMLTEPDGLLHRFIIYAGAADVEVGGQGHAEKVVMKLMDELLGEGRAIYLDNYYNSVELTSNLLDKTTYSTGTLRSNRKNNPKDVVDAKLKKGQSIQRFSPEGINVTKWKDKRDVLTISSEFSGDFVELTTKRQKKINKPDVVVQYNKYMGGVDRLDQYLSYYILHRRSLRWYKKLAFHIMEIMLLNAYLLYRRYSNASPKLPLHDFRLAVVVYLCGEVPSPSTTHLPTQSQPTTLYMKHFPQLQKLEQYKKRKQLRCRQCYKTKTVKYVTSFCPGCPENPGLCINDCFVKYHRSLGFSVVE